MKTTSKMNMTSKIKKIQKIKTTSKMRCKWKPSVEAYYGSAWVIRGGHKGREKGLMGRGNWRAIPNKIKGTKKISVNL